MERGKAHKETLTLYFPWLFQEYFPCLFNWGWYGTDLFKDIIKGAEMSRDVITTVEALLEKNEPP